MKYIVMRSVFGDYWIAKTKAKLPKGKEGFDNFEDAREEAQRLNDSIENQEELENLLEGDIEEVKKEMFRWLV